LRKKKENRERDLVYAYVCWSTPYIKGALPPLNILLPPPPTPRVGGRGTAQPHKRGGGMRGW
jgi:hypothetical protein